MFTIDTHTHIIPKHIPDFTKKFGYGNFIQLDHHAPGRAWMMKGEKSFREIRAVEEKRKIDELTYLKNQTKHLEEYQSSLG